MLSAPEIAAPCARARACVCLCVDGCDYNFQTKHLNMCPGEAETISKARFAIFAGQRRNDGCVCDDQCTGLYGFAFYTPFTATLAHTHTHIHDSAQNPLGMF